MTHTTDWRQVFRSDDATETWARNFIKGLFLVGFVLGSLFGFLCGVML